MDHEGIKCSNQCASICDHPDCNPCFRKKNLSGRSMENKVKEISRFYEVLHAKNDKIIVREKSKFRLYFLTPSYTWESTLMDEYAVSDFLLRN